MRRVQIQIQGIVQGVGFRPYVYRLANELILTGLVKNNPAGVHIEIQGTQVDYFLNRIQKELPPHAVIDQLTHETIDVNHRETNFRIVESDPGLATTKISPDISICNHCLDELFDPHNRFYHYPFINCMHCGPRYSIVEQLPYDRAKTTMSHFPMCADCQTDYENPVNRRYHAQPIACRVCGPSLSHSIDAIADAIKQGKIVAIKALGGFQLVGDTSNENVIHRLRQHKKRSTKPFALMQLNTASVARIADVSVTEEKILTSYEKPIVLLHKKNKNLFTDIAPNLNTLGVMLPYTAIHYLLFHALLNFPSGTQWMTQENNIVLIVTSGNDESIPIIKDNEEAIEKLNSSADLVVTHNRDIVTRVDDSVVRVINQKPMMIRRARGYSLRAIPLPNEIPPTLALGAYLKNTICVTRKNEAFVSQHIGNLSNRDSIRFYTETIQHLQKLLNVTPACVAHDLHPDFYSTKIAEQFDAPVFAIQHHHAHLAACAAENHITDPALGLALDGFGLGDDGESWGGELLFYQTKQIKRIAHLKSIKQPGGDRAAREPWRMAMSVLYELNQYDEALKKFSHHKQVEAVWNLLKQNIHSPMTSSCGRWFDAASGLLGVCDVLDYEGQAAMMLESLVTQNDVFDKGWKIESNQLNLLPLFEKLVSTDPVIGANLFHGTLSAALVDWVKQTAQSYSVKNVLLSGGCFLNKVLTENIITQLIKLNLNPIYATHCPPNDAGISLGQAWIAGNQLMETITCA